MKMLLTTEERDQIFSSLNPAQRIFLEQHVKSGKRSAFANELAKKKGVYYHEELTDEQKAELIDDWLLEDYIDAGESYRLRNPLLMCECGRVLRYQYIVKHATTQEIRKFGIEHFTEHTGIPSEIVKAVLEGMHNIDYELDELLVKIRDGWEMKEATPYLQRGVQLPEEIAAQIALELPLSYKQIRKIVKLFEEQEREKRLSKLENSTSAAPEMAEEFSQMDLFSLGNESISKKDVDDDSTFTLTNDLKRVIQCYLADGVTSARLICELLIRDHGANDVRFVTEKPKIYVDVCQYIESFGSVILTAGDQDDRFYQFTA